MDAAELLFAGLARQAELVRDREVSPRELVQACLDRIERLDPALRAFRVVLGEQALAEADRAASQAPEGRPLHGVPVAIKDDTDLAGQVTARGSAGHGEPAAHDAAEVRRLRAAGAIVIGKTQVPELMQWPFTESATFGATRNPWDLARTPGGSSGGSGAAVAAGLVGGSLGSDGAGSIRVPAACCGVFGLKTQRGRVPHRDHWHGLSVAGPLARRVQDAALLLDAVAGEAPAGEFRRAARTAPGRLAVAVAVAPPLPMLRLAPDCRRAVEEMGAVLRSLGHRVSECEPAYRAAVPHVLARHLRGIHDCAATMPHPERFERRTQRMVRLGGAVPPAAIVVSRRREPRLAARLNRSWQSHDVLVTPALASLPLPVGSHEGRGALATLNGSARFVPYSAAWNLTGQPAAVVPVGFTDDGLPLTVQVVGKPGGEATLLSLAAQIEAHRPWAQHRPPIS